MAGPSDTVDHLTEAINRGDLEAALALYEPNAVLVVQPGHLACWGYASSARRSPGLSRSEPTLRSEAQEVIVAGDLALYAGAGPCGHRSAGHTVVMAANPLTSSANSATAPGSSHSIIRGRQDSAVAAGPRPPNKGNNILDTPCSSSNIWPSAVQTERSTGSLVAHLAWAVWLNHTGEMWMAITPALRSAVLRDRTTPSPWLSWDPFNRQKMAEVRA